MLQNLFRYKVKFLINLEVDFVATWLQLGPQLGGQQRNIGSIFSNLTSIKIQLGAILGPEALWDRFLLDFGSICYRFLIDFLIVFLIGSCQIDPLFKSYEAGIFPLPTRSHSPSHQV